MNKNAIIVVVAAVVLGTVLFMIGGMSGGDEGGSEGTSSGAKAKAVQAGELNAKAPKVTKDEEKAEIPEQARRDLALPENLPKLNVEDQKARQAAPVKPHGELILEGQLKEVDAKVAIAAIFPKVRSCYVELRQRAPQAQGRML
ncbi:MAG TPA: hypothetical protein DCQ06_05335, partial [Myxococcales bacterium]|nr:hypothetical protein [Myxococcales bacterium]